MLELDPGHRYRVEYLDSEEWDNCGYIVFVKREGPGFPGNVGKHAGTNIQECLRVLIARQHYLQKQKRHWVNPVCVFLYRVAFNLLEYRAARRHHKAYWWHKKIELVPFGKDGHLV